MRAPSVEERWLGRAPVYCRGALKCLTRSPRSVRLLSSWSRAGRVQQRLRQATSAFQQNRSMCGVRNGVKQCADRRLQRCSDALPAAVAKKHSRFWGAADAAADSAGPSVESAVAAVTAAPRVEVPVPSALAELRVHMESRLAAAALAYPRAAAALQVSDRGVNLSLALQIPGPDRSGHADVRPAALWTPLPALAHPRAAATELKLSLALQSSGANSSTGLAVDRQATSARNVVACSTFIAR